MHVGELGNPSHTGSSHGAAHFIFLVGCVLTAFPPLIESYHAAGNERGPFLRATVLSYAL